VRGGTSVLGHYAFTKHLLPALLAAARTAPDGRARVVVTSSMAAYLNTIHWGSFEPGPARDGMTTYELYDQSKHVRNLSVLALVGRIDGINTYLP
jgi:retinol dehydrogenase-12